MEQSKEQMMDLSVTFHIILWESVFFMYIDYIISFLWQNKISKLKCNSSVIQLFRLFAISQPSFNPPN